MVRGIYKWTRCYVREQQLLASTEMAITDCRIKMRLEICMKVAK
jgi:hypothetical protein